MFCRLTGCSISCIGRGCQLHVHNSQRGIFLVFGIMTMRSAARNLIRPAFRYVPSHGAGTASSTVPYIGTRERRIMCVSSMIILSMAYLGKNSPSFPIFLSVTTLETDDPYQPAQPSMVQIVPFTYLSNESSFRWSFFAPCAFGKLSGTPYPTPP